MNRPDLNDFLRPATTEKRAGHQWKAFVKKQDEYISYLLGIIAGKELKLPKEQLPLTCKKCEEYESQLSIIANQLNIAAKSIDEAKIFIAL